MLLKKNGTNKKKTKKFQLIIINFKNLIGIITERILQQPVGIAPQKMCMFVRGYKSISHVGRKQ